MYDRLYEMIGREQPLQAIGEALKDLAIATHPAMVGAHHLTCSDETELECIDVFSKIFVKPLLPTLKLSQQSAFRTANLGARYEWSSVRVAEHHFATSETASTFKLMILKINAHTSREIYIDGPRYGSMDRYFAKSDCCGALFAMMRGASFPAIKELRDVFEWEGVNRLGALTGDDAKVPEPLRGLVAAILQARLQARLAMVDIRDHAQHTPTLWVVVPCVTINIPELDRELLCGVYTADLRGDAPRFSYRGLGDDPANFAIEHDRWKIIVTEPGMDRQRDARDHRQAPLVRFLEATAAERGEDAVVELSEGSGELAELLERLERRAPREGALRLFASGLVPIHHVLSADRVARDPGASHDVKVLFASARSAVKGLNPSGEAATGAKGKLLGILRELVGTE